MNLVRIGIVCAALSCGASTGSAQTAPAQSGGDREGMVLVPAGEFVIGSQRGDRWAEADEEPQRVVNLPAFYIDQLEVTNLQFRRFLDATAWKMPPEWHARILIEDAEFLPVTGVSWWDATAYARWAGKRLPTEVEWEKAARGTDARRFPWGNDWNADRANNERYVLPVGSKSSGASPCGALDMAGNAAEWTSSVFAPYPRIEAVLPKEFGGTTATNVGAPAVLPTPAQPVTTGATVQPAASGGAIATDDTDAEPPDPRLQRFTAEELADDRARVYRGGSFNSFARFLRCANRESSSPGSRWDNVGFRCAADAAPSGGSKP